MRAHRSSLSILLLPLLVACARAPSPPPVAATEAPDLLARGEYVVRLGGCNDCHTTGYSASGGTVPKDRWLTGSSHGFMGPWGTTYPTNLRLSMSRMSEADWLVYSRTFHTRPPMPDYMVRELPEEDRRALYRFVISLGTAGAGVEAPAYLPPGQTPPPPYFRLVLPPQAAGNAGQAGKPTGAPPGS